MPRISDGGAELDDDEVCPICLLADSEREDSETNKWVECEQCKRWFHFECAKVSLSVKEKTWLCQTCMKKNLALPEESKKAEATKKPNENMIEELMDELEKSEESYIAAEKRAKAAESNAAFKSLEIQRLKSLLAYQEAAKGGEIVDESEMSSRTRVKPRKLNLSSEEDETKPSAVEKRLDAYRRRSTVKISCESEDDQSETSEDEATSKTDVKINPKDTDTTLDILAAVMRRQFIQKLPNFDGEVKEWAQFQSIYESTTKEGKFTESENVIRLRECLKGAARGLVKDLLCFGNDGTRIMKILKENFGRDDKLIVRLTDELLMLPELKSSGDIRIRNFAVDVNTYVANLKVMKREKHLCNEYALSKLTAKLYPGHYVHWSRIKKKNPDADIEDFGEFLTLKVTELPPNIDSNAISTRDFKPKYNEPHRAMTHMVETENKECVKCNENHPLYYCRGFKALSIAERRKFAFAHKICFCCLRSSEHRAMECPFKRECQIEGCTQTHNRALHFPSDKRKFEVGSTAKHLNMMQLTNSTQPQSSSQAIGLTRDSNIHVGTIPEQMITPRKENDVHEINFHYYQEVFGKILPVRVYGLNDNYIDTYAFLDDGSYVSLMDKELCDWLRIEGEAERLRLKWTKGITREEDARRCSVIISGQKMSKRFTLGNVYCIENLDLPRQSQNATDLKTAYSHFDNIPIPTFNDIKPKILIGLEHAKFLMADQHRMGKDEEPIASKTKLGWVVYGKNGATAYESIEGAQKQMMLMSINEATNSDDELHNLVKDHFKLEDFGIIPFTKQRLSKEVARAENIMKSTLKFRDNRYEIGLLWKSENIHLPDSRPMALNRLYSFEKTLLKNIELKTWMCDHMKQLQEKEYLREANEHELMMKWDRVWYCPLFIVVNRNKVPPKPRCVADVAAKVNGVSLNTFLLKGPDNLAPLLSGLSRFREKAVAVNADVKEMFHQIRIRLEDQQCQRILWRDCDPTKIPKIYIMQAMMFGPTCSPSIAQFVKNQHADRYSEKYPEAVNALKQHTYVDDYFNSHATVEDAVRVTSNAIKICAEMSFDLVGLQSNNDEFLKRMPERILKRELIEVTVDENPNCTSKVLGMHWNTIKDKFIFKRVKDDSIEKMFKENYHPTKREVLRTLMKIFDPLGLIAHFTIRGKMIMQDVWRDGTNWDEPISDNLTQQWCRFINGLIKLEKLEIPRHYAAVNSDECSIQLITFVDASDKAFAAVVYFLFENENEKHISLVMAKAKVAPVKPLTIPQLELQAAILGIRLTETVENLHSFKIKERKFVSDSTCVLDWINSKTYKFKPYVGARIGEILDKTTRREWFYIRSEHNVADEATKLTTDKFNELNTRWFAGPHFLKDDESKWLIEIPKSRDNLQYDELHCQHHSKETQEECFNELDRVNARFKTKWLSLLRVFAYVIRFIKQCKNRNALPEHITVPEYRLAEKLVFKKVQAESFPDEIQSFKLWLTRDTRDEIMSVKLSSKIFSLTPFMDEEGLIRMSSRSQFSKQSYAAKNPVILPNRHELIDIMVKHYHEMNLHVAEASTIADIRERAWIIAIRQTVRRISKQCQHCRNRNAKPVMPQMGNLHPARLAFEDKPFTHVGVDCFGPYEVKIGRTRGKRYGIIFTCLTFRAVHLEVLSEMSTDRCLSAIRKLRARRGKIRHLYSDNGKNFVGANNQMHRDLMEMSKVLGEEVAKQFEIEWHFIPAYSPWMGGAWERLIQIVKKTITFWLNGEIHQVEILTDAFIEAEYQINKRPLTHVPIDIADKKPLTPNLMMFGDEENSLAVGIYDENDKYSTKGYRRVQHLADKFAYRWVKEYLPEITKRDRWHRPVKPLVEGDIVIVIEPQEPRDAWKLGRIIKAHKSSDDQTRSADVKMSDGTIKKNRSAGRLAVIPTKGE